MKGIASLALIATAAASLAAETTRGAVPVTLTVEPGCSVDAAPLAFGTIGDETGDTAASAQAALTLRCTPGIAYAVALDQGRSGGRRMADASGDRFALYDIFQDAGARQRWSDDPAGTISGLSPASGEIALTAYGRILFPASLEPGSYSDIVTVTVAF